MLGLVSELAVEGAVEGAEEGTGKTLIEADKGVFGSSAVVATALRMTCCTPSLLFSAHKVVIADRSLGSKLVSLD